MNKLSMKDIYDLLGSRDIPGTDEQLKKLCIRVSELADLNGKDWVVENRQKLLDEWKYIVRQGLMT
jgi:hypothetical protein